MTSSKSLKNKIPDPPEECIWKYSAYEKGLCKLELVSRDGPHLLPEIKDFKDIEN